MTIHTSGSQSTGFFASSIGGVGGDGGSSVPVLVLTHPTREVFVRSALEQIAALGDLSAPTRVVRIEEGL